MSLAVPCAPNTQQYAHFVKKTSTDYVEILTIQPATRHFVDIRFKLSDSERKCAVRTYHFQGPDQ